MNSLKIVIFQGFYNWKNNFQNEDMRNMYRCNGTDLGAIPDQRTWMRFCLGTSSLTCL